jgi:AcrR family transcriptional regulator
MDMRARILAETRRLTLERGVVPSLNVVAEAAGVSKGGLIHHFPSRAALVDGLAGQALDEVDAAMREAAAEGNAASAWLRLSVPSGDDLELFRAIAIAHRALEAPGAATVAAADEATATWERMIADEVGDAVRARVIRLVGDGLAMNALAGVGAPLGDDELTELEQHLIGRRRADRS